MKLKYTIYTKNPETNNFDCRISTFRNHQEFTEEDLLEWVKIKHDNIKNIDSVTVENVEL